MIESHEEDKLGENAKSIEREHCKKDQRDMVERLRAGESSTTETL